MATAQQGNTKNTGEGIFQRENIGAKVINVEFSCGRGIYLFGQKLKTRSILLGLCCVVPCFLRRRLRITHIMDNASPYLLGV